MSMTPPVNEAPVKPPKRSNSALIVVVILGGLTLMCILCVAVFAAILFPVFRQARQVARRTDAMERMKGVGLAARMYAVDNDDHLPLAASWMDGVTKYDSRTRDFHSPGIDRRNPLDPPEYGIAFMHSLSGVKLGSVKDPSNRVMIFDTTLYGRNATSGLETIPKPPRFGSAETGGNIFAFVDGHVKRVSAAEAVNLK